MTSSKSITPADPFDQASDVDLSDEVHDELLHQRELETQEFLRSADPAIQGQGGRAQTWKVIRSVVGRGLDPDGASEVIIETYNPRCRPPWSDDDIRDMCLRAAGRRPSRPEPSDLPAEILDVAYRTILSGLTLRYEHEQALLARGLTKAEIERLGYRTWTYSVDRWTRIINEVRSKIGEESLFKVPGIVRPESPEFSIRGDGIAVPVRNMDGLIVGIRIRQERQVFKKKGGMPALNSDGSPKIDKSYVWLSWRKSHPEDARVSLAAHVPVRDQVQSLVVVRLTEGEIKADICTRQTGILTISVPGVGSWKLGTDVIRALEAKRALIAFDADCQKNPDVARAILNAAAELQAAGIEIAIETWEANFGKGIDDVIRNGHANQIRVLDGAEAEDWLDELARTHKLSCRKLGIDLVGLAAEGEPQAGSAPAASHEVAARVPIEIRVGADTNRMVEQGIVALTSDKDIYARGDALVRVLDAGAGPEAKAVRASVLRLVHLARSASWRVFDAKAREWLPVKPPQDIAQAVHDHQVWPGVRHLVGIVDSPVIRPDGSILDVPGFDEATGLLLIPSADFGVITAEPTAEEVAGAKALLLGVVKDFPLLSSGRSCWLAMVLSYFGRPMVSGPVPGFVIDANTRSAGKGLLSDVTGRICYGRPLPITNPTEDEEELRKRITAMLIKGAGMVLVDNLPTNGNFGNATWDRLLTSFVWEDRILGVSDTVTRPNNAIWIFNGNNVLVIGDTVRRVLHIRLESPLEHPEKRDLAEFTHPDLRAWVIEHRIELVRAALILLRAWVVAGRPSGRARLGSFESWAATVAACVEWLGLGDVTATQQEYAQRTASGDAGPLRRLIVAWKEAFGSDEKKASAVLQLIKDEDDRVRAEKRRQERLVFPGGNGADVSMDDDADPPVHRYQDLRDAVVEFCGRDSGKMPNSSWLGRYLQGTNQRVVGGLRFLGRVDRSDVTYWSLVPVADGEGSSAGSCRETAGARPKDAPAHVRERNHEVDTDAGSAGAYSASLDDHSSNSRVSNDDTHSSVSAKHTVPQETEMPRLPRHDHELSRIPAAESAGSRSENAPADAPAHAPALALPQWIGPVETDQGVTSVLCVRTWEGGKVHEHYLDLGTPETASTTAQALGWSGDYDDYGRAHHFAANVIIGANQQLEVSQLKNEERLSATEFAALFALKWKNWKPDEIIEHEINTYQ